MKLLIAYDGSSCADAALEDLRRAGLPHAAEVLVLSVADVLLPPNSGTPEQPAPEWVVAAMKKARAHATQAVEKARVMAVKAGKRLHAEHPGWGVHAEARGDSPAWAIIGKAGEWKADLVVVGSHGRSSIGRLVLGSVSQRVVGDAPCSVRVVRGPSNKKRPVRVIVGIDGSPDSEMALREVAGRAWPADSAIRVVTAIDSLISTTLAYSALDPAAAGRLTRNEIDARALVTRVNQAAAEKLRVTGLAVSSLVKEGSPAHILVKEAKRWKSDCIFVGAKGLRGIERFLLGSVSTAVTARAPCSVEVVRSKRPGA